MDGSPELGCENKKHVLKWTLTRLKPKNSSEARQMMYDFDEEIEARIGGEWIVENLVLGDNVPILSDHQGQLLIHFGFYLWTRVHTLLN